MPSIPADSIRSPRATDEVVAMLFKTRPPWPSPRTTPSSPVRAMRAPAAAEASSRSWALETPWPTVTTRPTRPAGTASGEPGTTPSAEPAPMRTLCDPARCSSSRIGTLPTTPGSADPAPSRRRSSSRWSASARSRKSSRSRASSSRRSRSFSERAPKSAKVDSTAPQTEWDTEPTAAATGADRERNHAWSTVPRPRRDGAYAESSRTQATRTDTSTAPPRRGLTAATSTRALGGLMDRGAGLGSRDRYLPQEVHVGEHGAGAQGNRRQRVFRVGNGQPRLLGEPAVEVTQQRSAPRDDDALVHDVRRKLGGRALESDADGLDDRGHHLRKGLSHLLVGQLQRLRHALDEVAALDLHRERLVERVRGSDLDLDLLSRPLADEEVVLALEVLDERLVHLVRCGADRAAVDDAGERNDRDVGRSTADVHDHVAGRLRDGQPGSDRGRHRLLDNEDFRRPGAQGRVLDRALLDLRDPGRDR